MSLLKALLIDDDVKFCQTFQTLAENTFDLAIVHSGKEGMEFLKKTTPEVVLLDLKLGKGMNGLEVLKRIKRKNLDIPVIMITDFADVPTAVEAMKLGALHYTSKSPNINALKLIIDRQLEQVNWKLLYQEYTSAPFDQFIAESPIMQPIVDDVKKISRTNATVLILGESGTGKEVTARTIHARSPRKDKPFVSINCSNLSPQLFESELFGHEKGAFTGADFQKKGKLELAHTGTIFLDEIGDLPLECQAKILRAIEDKEFQRLGGIETIHVDVRTIVASNKDLQQMVTENLFREDLYYRLNVISIKLPPLRQRPEDLPALFELFLMKYAQEMKKQKPEISPEALAKLKQYAWHGIIRELRNYIENLMVFHSGEDIIDYNDIHLPSEQEPPQFPSQLLELPYEQAKQTLFNDFKRVYFKKALDRCDGNITVTAKEVGINRATLHKILKGLVSGSGL